MTKEQLDLPIYRGKSIKTKQYVEGYLKPCADTGANIYWIQTKDWIDYQIDPRSLCISFSDMLDINGVRIFASLPTSYNVGDIMKDDDYYGSAKYINCEFVVEYENCYDNISEGNFEVVGVPEWTNYQ